MEGLAGWVYILIWSKLKLHSITAGWPDIKSMKVTLSKNVEVGTGTNIMPMISC